MAAVQRPAAAGRPCDFLRVTTRNVIAVLSSSELRLVEIILNLNCLLGRSGSALTALLCGALGSRDRWLLLSELHVLSLVVDSDLLLQISMLVQDWVVLIG